MFSKVSKFEWPTEKYIGARPDANPWHKDRKAASLVTKILEDNLKQSIFSLPISPYLYYQISARLQSIEEDFWIRNEINEWSMVATVLTAVDLWCTSRASRHVQFFYSSRVIAC